MYAAQINANRLAGLTQLRSWTRQIRATSQMLNAIPRTENPNGGIYLRIPSRLQPLVEATPGLERPEFTYHATYQLRETRLVDGDARVVCHALEL